MLAYAIDADDRIREIAGTWDEFAIDNAAPGLLRDRVLGTALLDHVTGPEVRQLTRMLLDRARRGPTRDIDFRCDSPGERRYLRMRLSSLPSNGVRIETTLLRSAPRASRNILDVGSARSDELLVACSWCVKIKLPDGRFVEIDEAVDAMGLFGDGAIPRLTHGICSACRGSLGRPSPAA
jgi:hypothetical protein